MDSEIIFKQKTQDAVTMPQLDCSYLEKYISNCQNPVIIDSYVKANSVINNPRFKKVMCSVSGGADSDLMVDIITKVDVDKKVDYVFF